MFQSIPPFPDSYPYLFTPSTGRIVCDRLVPGSMARNTHPICRVLHQIIESVGSVRTSFAMVAYLTLMMMDLSVPSKDTTS